TLVRDKFIAVVGGPSMSRRVAALEALRYMRPEAILPVMRHIVSAALNSLQDDQIVPELILLIRRVFSYRHLATAQAFEEEQVVSQEFDKAAAHAQPGSQLRNSIDQINVELVGGPQPQLNLLSIIRELEKLFQTTSRQSHRLISELSKYINGPDEGEHVEVI